MARALEDHLSEGQGYPSERHKTPQSAENLLQVKHIQQRADAPDVERKSAGTPYALNVAQQPLCFNLIIFPVGLSGSVSLRKPPAFPSSHAISLYNTSTLVSCSSQLLHNHTNRIHMFIQDPKLKRWNIFNMSECSCYCPTGDYFLKRPEMF